MIGGLSGTTRGKARRTTIADRPQPVPPISSSAASDLAPNRLWVADLTHVSTWAGIRLRGLCHRRLRSQGILGWRVAAMATSMVLDAIRASHLDRQQEGVLDPERRYPPRIGISVHIDPVPAARRTGIFVGRAVRKLL